MQGFKESLFKAMDLNLLVSLHALLEEQHITRAADRVGLSQPAMSRALNRLRKEFNDPLLVKGNNGFELTPRAQALSVPLRQLIRDIQGLYQPASFDPATAQGEFRIAGLDYEYIVLLPLLTERLRLVAPGITIKALPFSQEDFGILQRDEVHLILTAIEHVPENLFRQQLFTEHNVCMVNPLFLEANRHLPMDRFTDLEHVWVYLRSQDPGQIDKTLKDMGLNRNIVNTLPTFFLSAFTVASSTSLVTVLPSRVEKRLKWCMPLTILDVPINFREFRVFQIWHERYHTDEMHKFMRKLIADISNDV
ncbi:MAG: LysR family transcriptional regulator [Desulfopila sp.]